jgi:protein tyrosine phosphatase
MYKNRCAISHIYKNIYISDIAYALNINELITNKINAVLYLGTHNKAPSILNKYQTHNISHKFLKISDACDSNITECFELAWNYINKQIKNGCNILIHCKMGISRSPTIVAYYLTRKMHEHMINKGSVEPVLDDVLTLIKMNRPCSHPNKYFIQQLKSYENIKINLLGKPSIKTLVK